MKKTNVYIVIYLYTYYIMYTSVLHHLSGEPILLGEGAFGKVELVKNEAGEPFARKICTRKKYISNTIHEANVMQKLKGCNTIVQLIDTVPNENDQGVDLILERCDGTLLDLVEESGGLSEDIVCDVARDVANGIAFMRSKGFSHCDLKMENILYKHVEDSISGYRFLIADFGNAEEGDSLSHYYRIQTNHYRCSENLLQELDIRTCDIPSLACILYESITGEYLINRTDDEEYEPDQLEDMMNIIGLELLSSYSFTCKEKKSMEPYLKNASIKGSISLPDSILEKSYETLGYTKRKEMTDLIKRLLLPYPTKRLKADQVQYHPAIKLDLKTEKNSKHCKRKLKF
jgi:serine/threonine protein kinase